MKRARLLCAALTLALAILPVSATDDGIVYHAHANTGGKIALTFDDGPHPYRTREILAILAEYDVRATFFVVGENVEFYPDVIADVQRGGHEIGNHSYDHSRAGLCDPARAREEILRTESVVAELCDARTRLFRPPEGNLPNSLVDTARALDYTIILWNIDTRDWDHTPPAAIADHVAAHVKAGDIILMHDYIAHDSPTPEALRLLIPRLLAQGYRFVTVSELLGSK